MEILKRATAHSTRPKSRVYCYEDHFDDGRSDKKRPIPYCYALMCPNTSEANPNKIFFYIPTKAERRELWLKRLKRDPPKTQKFYVCEDHFDLEKDTDNFMQSRIVGCRLRLRADVLPNRFSSVMTLEYTHDTVVEDDIYDPEEEPEPALEQSVDPQETSKANDEMEWTKEQVENLIAEYRQRPALWDPNDPQYRRNVAKYEAWNGLAQMFECDIADLRKKLTSVFASYRRERSRVRRENYSNWFLYDLLSFIPNHIPNGAVGSVQKSEVPSKRSRKLYKSSSDESDQNDEDDQVGSETEVHVKQEPQEVVAVVYEQPPKMHSKKRLTRGGGERTQVDPLPKISEVRLDSEVRREPESSRDGKDECDSFGEYIAMSLRKHDERTRATMKQAINNIIYELELKKYNNEPYSVIASNVNPLNGYGT